MSAPRTVAGAALLGLAEGAAAFLVLVLAVWLAVHALAPSPLAGDHCPAPDYAVMTPTGPGCATSLTLKVGGR